MTSRYNAYAFPSLAILSSFAILAILILEFSVRGLTVGTGLMALGAVIIYTPLLRYVYNDLQLNRDKFLKFMLGAPLGLFAYGLFTITWLGLYDVGFVIILLAVGWILLSLRKMVDQKLRRID